MLRTFQVIGRIVSLDAAVWVADAAFQFGATRPAIAVGLYTVAAIAGLAWALFRTDEFAGDPSTTPYFWAWTVVFSAAGYIGYLYALDAHPRPHLHYGVSLKPYNINAGVVRYGVPWKPNFRAYAVTVANDDAAAPAERVGIRFLMPGSVVHVDISHRVSVTNAAVRNEDDAEFLKMSEEGNVEAVLPAETNYFCIEADEIAAGGELEVTIVLADVGLICPPGPDPDTGVYVIGGKSMFRFFGTMTPATASDAMLRIVDSVTGELAVEPVKGPVKVQHMKGIDLNENGIYGTNTTRPNCGRADLSP